MQRTSMFYLEESTGIVTWTKEQKMELKCQIILRADQGQQLLEELLTVPAGVTVKGESLRSDN